MQLILKKLSGNIFSFFPHESRFNPFPNKHWFLPVWGRSLLKTLWQKAKLLVTNNLSFSHNVFYPIWYLLAPLAVGQRAYVMVRCPSCVRPSVRALTFSLNIFFAETTYRILMKFHRNVPTMVIFRIS